MCLGLSVEHVPTSCREFIRQARSLKRKGAERACVRVLLDDEHERSRRRVWRATAIHDEGLWDLALDSYRDAAPIC